MTGADSINVLGMINEYKRQPLFNFEGKYETQKEFLFDYKGLQLRATLDRFMENVEGQEK